jgi:hypothetical protein
MNSKPPPPPPTAMSKPPPPLPHSAHPSVRPPPPPPGGSVVPPLGSVRPSPSAVHVQVQAPALPSVWQSRQRVSVRASARDPNLLVVRPLPEGQRPPPGTHVAHLVLVEGEESGSP